MYVNRLFAAAALFVLGCAIASAASIGQMDTFTTGTQNWVAPDPDNPNPPTTALGGPGGALDQYLKLVANGGDFAPETAGSRMTVLNGAQWAGNYVAAGIGGIALDVNNLGPDPLYLRLLFESFPGIPGSTPPSALAFSTNAIFVPVRSGWMHIVFPIAPGNLMAPIPGTTAAQALADVDVLRIFNNPNPAFGGPQNGPPMVHATLGVDNITAVPEPGSAALIGIGLFLVLRSRKTRQS